MTKPKIIFGVFAILLLAVSNSSAQEFTLTTTPANVISSKALIDMPGLSGNPLAIIVATPIGNTALLNTHPIGAWYYSGKWNIFNTDHAVMPVGAKYKVKFFKEPGANQFLHVITKQSLGAEGSYIDNPALNNNPNAHVEILQNHAAEVRSPYYLNPFAAKAAYSPAAGRWYIANINDEPLYAATAYNVVVTSAGGEGANTNPPIAKPPPTVARLPDAEKVPVPTEKVPVIQLNQPVTPITKIELPSRPPRTPVKWTLRPEPPPRMAANAEVLLFIHGMDSRAEEADDITRALFALKASMPAPVAPPTPPVSGSTQNPQMVAVLQQLLKKYKGCILEKYETQEDMRNRGLLGNLSGLLHTGGLQDRDTVACVAGNMCSRAFRQTNFSTLQAQAIRGEATNFEANLKKIIPKDCFDCLKHVEWHTKHVHCTMDAGGNSGFQGPGFEACKAGVDMEKLASDVTRDIVNIISNVTGIVPPTQAIGGASVATNFSTVEFKNCTNPAKGCPESCDHNDAGPEGARTAVLPRDLVSGQPLYYVAPQNMLDKTPPNNNQINVPVAHNIGSNEGRLILALRKAAADPTRLQSLRLAAYAFAESDNAMGNAFADLSVTGRRAFGDFSKDLPSEDFCQLVTKERPSRFNESKVLDGCRTALDRAYRVANFLRTGQRGDTPAEKTKKTTERLALGWIAVSGEDDSPHRPVNVPSSDFPQYDIDVVVGTPLATGSNTTTVRARYVIAESPPIGNTRKTLVVISLDLPTSGYSQNLDYEVVSPLSEIGHPKWTTIAVPIIIPNELLYMVAGVPPLPSGPITVFPDFQATGKTPLLDFIENFIVSFVETVDLKKVPIKNKIKAVMGGSLGGNMTFRLGRRPGVPWLPKFIVWSPASIWNSLGEGNDVLKHLAPRKGWEGANQASKSPGAGDRAEFFGSWDKPIVPVIIDMAQSDTWTSDYYACKKSSVAAARLDRHETYDANFLAWHWRLGAEQLLYSHQTIDPATNQPRYMANHKPMLLACGTEDHVKFNDICPATQRTAPLMTLTPGKALFLDKTGHSLDNERRSYWARQIVEFLGL